MTVTRRAALSGAAAAIASTPAWVRAAARPVSGPMEVVRLDPRLDALIAPDEPVVRVATGFTFTEGPMWRQGRLWFSDLGGDNMMAVAPDGTAKILLTQAGGFPRPWPIVNLGSNAMVPDKDGTVLMARQGGRTIVRVDAALRVHDFLSAYQGKRFNSPNDLVFAPDGALWFTDPPFGLPKMDRDPAKELPFNAVFRYRDGKLTPIITDFTLPNGIGFSPDGRTLYVSNYGEEMYVKAFEVRPDGKLSGARTLIAYPASTDKGGPDGLKIDALGNLWSTGPGGIRIITPQGNVLGQIKLPEVAANLAFADDWRTLYITASTSIYRLKTRVRGEKPLYA
ncbi:SMP-30/gluconolactonase/LRE family protein [Caulobacter sp. S45]|uniref:SMP-30/gluconolactonase/LRE family protein n=1 Tax=Caulobacter sp. S45 TaxID=1641861 RepID=UPI00131B0F86|nr:SMP-30/gluconolactonase/LRE family protein [Caulobacter sp. S45]